MTTFTKVTILVVKQQLNKTMKYYLKLNLVVILSLLLCVIVFAQQQNSISLKDLSYPKNISKIEISSTDKKSVNYVPIKNGNKKWRIAYLEGGPYIEYRESFISLVKGLMEIGWIQKENIPHFKEEELIKETEDIPSKELWEWLTTGIKSDYIEFIKDGHYSSDWDDDLRIAVREEVINRLNQGNIDLIIAAGTRAGNDLATNDHTTPTVVISTSSPIEAGIIKSAEDSGFDHVLAQLDPDQWERQLKLFHSVVKFKKLGIAYENTKDGKSYAALSSVEKTAKDRNFEIVHCHAPSDAVGEEESYQKLLECHEKIAEEVDAMFLTEHGGFGGNFDKLIAPFLDKKIPTLSQKGYGHVSQGVLLGIGSTNYDNLGIYYAQVIQRIFNGEKPRDISQIFSTPTVIAINLKTAKKLNFTLTTDILRAADKIFY